MSFRLVLCSLFVISSYLNAAGRSDFDNVIFESNLVHEPVEAGFGVQFLLKMLMDPEVKAAYEQISALGTLKILAQKLAPQNDGETQTTRIIFEAWARTGLFSSKRVATLSIDRYSLYAIMDDRPSLYRVSEIVRDEK